MEPLCRGHLSQSSNTENIPWRRLQPWLVMTMSFPEAPSCLHLETDWILILTQKVVSVLFVPLLAKGDLDQEP